jgi:hypothetical protein
MVGMMKQYFIQASPIKDFAALWTLGEVFPLFGGKLFVFVGCRWRHADSHQRWNQIPELIEHPGITSA